MIVRPIRFTERPQEHARIFRALGARVYGESDAPWVLMAFGRGRVAFHLPHAGRVAGSTALGFEVSDVTEWASSNEYEVSQMRQGPAIVVAAEDGQILIIDNSDPRVDAAEASLALASGGTDVSALAVAPLWLTPDVAGARGVLEELGGRLDITSNSGTWADCQFDSGRVAAHVAEDVRAELSFHFDGNIEVLRDRAQAGGISAVVVDEGYGRSLRMADPDNPDEDIVINEQQSDLYGYEKH